VILNGNPAKLQEFSTFPANQPVKMQGQGRKKEEHPRETLRKEVVSLFAFVSRQNDWFAEKSFYDIIIFR
jgi:hypothetical protein